MRAAHPIKISFKIRERANVTISFGRYFYRHRWFFFFYFEVRNRLAGFKCSFEATRYIPQSLLFESDYGIEISSTCMADNSAPFFLANACLTFMTSASHLSSYPLTSKNIKINPLAYLGRIASNILHKISISNLYPSK
ncbi:hypothetical protein AQUCO_01300816v1 [Aquilegia coerulea]|uniref:Uncharacterized protein n=1 Tax=Aquilegia coerulea TaxID=218851 RepID=A0A2G5E3J7_AQUCA|nr:hypothetical protein AQUCO_01300816v1 [Aquilegia coerulea]